MANQASGGPAAPSTAASHTAGRTPLCGEAEPLHPRYSCETIRQLASLLQAGLPLAEGLSLLAQQQSHAQWQALLEALGRELAQGVAFSAALAQWPQAFPPLYLAMISTGELTGKLDICCLQLANQQQEQQRLASKVKKRCATR